jgi:peptide/nickel transport system substrate-binding protein
MFGDRNRQMMVGVLLCAVLLAGLAGCGTTPVPTTSPPTQAAATEVSQAPTEAMPAPATAEPTQALAPTPVPQPTQAPAEKTSIVFAIPEDPPSFNASVSDTGYDALVMELALLGLSDVDPEGNVFPELAAELPTAENGGVVIDEDAWTMDVTWKMRNDVTWADGQPVTADDVIFTYNAIVDPVGGIWVPGIDYVDGVEKIDDYSFVVHYNYVYPGYLTQFGGEQLVVWPAHYCDASQGFTAWDCGRQPLSDGPYVLEDWQVGDHMTFERNPTYYEQDKPGIDQIIIRIVPDPSVAKTMLVQGDADVYMWATEQMIDDLKGVANVKVSQSPTSRWVMRLFPNEAAKGTIDPVANPHPILSDVRVRRAIRMAVDVDTISQQIFHGYGTPVWTEFFRPPYQCDIPRPAYDPAGAAALLEEAGWIDQDGDGVRECHGCTTGAEDGYVMQMEFMTYAEYGEPLELTQQLIGEQLGQIGIKLDLSVVEGSVMWADYESGGIEQQGNFDLNMWDDGYSGVDPTDFLWELYYSTAAEPDGGWNVVRWLNADFDGLLDEAYTLDEAYRQDLFCQMAQILEDQLPVIMLFSTVNADAYSARIEGVQSTVNDLVTWNVADWVVK